jgi:hypothetical protein
MADPLTWQIKFTNDSGPLKAATSEMDKFVVAMKAANDQLALIAKGEDKVGQEAEKGEKKTKSWFSQMLKADLIANAIERVEDKVIELGEAFVDSLVKAADLGYKSTVALTALTGSAEVAENIIQRANYFAKDTGENLELVRHEFQTLAAAGLRGDFLSGAVIAAHDFAATTGESAEGLTDMFKVIAGKGLDEMGLRRLQQYPGLLKEIEKETGHSTFQGLKAAFKIDPLQPTQAIALIEKAIKNFTHETNLGDVSEKFGMSFEGGIEKIKTNFTLMLEDLSQNPVFDHLRQSLSNVAKIFDPKSPEGKRFETAFAKAIDPVLKLIDKVLSNPDAIGNFFNKGLNAVEHIEKIAGVIIETIAVLKGIGIGAAAGTAIPGVGNIVGGIVGGAAAFAGAEGLKSYFSEDKPKEEPLDQTGDRHLPERIPHFAEGGVVSSPTVALVGEAGPEMIVPMDSVGKGGRGDQTNHVTINVQVSGMGEDHQIDEQSLAEKMRQILPGALISAFDQLGEQMGAA